MTSLYQVAVPNRTIKSISLNILCLLSLLKPLAVGNCHKSCLTYRGQAGILDGSLRKQDRPPNGVVSRRISIKFLE